MFIPFPDYQPKLKTADLKTQVWCIVRKKWVMFTKEEWVRQNWLNYLIEVLKYPASLIAVEKEIHLGELRKRFDILIYQNSQPFILIECKEEDTVLSEQTVQQILTYNIKLSVSYMILSNGKESFGVFVEDGVIHRISKMPHIVK